MNKYIEHILKLYKEKKIEQQAALSLLEAYKSLEKKEKTDDTIAIVGMSCKMPLADSKEEFWQNLESGVDCVRPFPEQRRKDTDPLKSHFMENLNSIESPYWSGGFLSSVDSFDNEFFRILPAEAKIMDPQQRIFLEIAHAAFEDAGYTTSKLRGSNTGIFVGDVVNEYRKIINEVSPLAVIGNVSPFIASRISYFYDLHGPAINVSTTCSTSLVAVHLACQSLLNLESDLILVGAINLRIFPFSFKDDPVDALGITSQSNGGCYAFDDRADGIARGEGAGALVLKRYQDALKDGNHIYGLIRGSHVNNDGKSSNVGSPNPTAHAMLMKKTWEKSGIDPRNISYIEAHGTGTRIGDPIEVQGITKAFSHFTQDKQFCGLGSVKTNIGHLTGGASGLAGLIKTVLALHYQKIPPSIHFKKPNEFIDFPSTPLFVVNKLLSWPRGAASRLAGVSAFGFNGTNCHILLEEAPLLQKETPTIKNALPFLFTHRTTSGLKKQIKKYLTFLESNKSEISLEDVSYTLAIGRDHYSKQTVVFASSLDELRSKMKDWLNDDNARVINENSFNWKEIFKDLKPRLISLPSYEFESKRFWIEAPKWNDDDKRVHVSSAAADKNHNSILIQLVQMFEEVTGISKIKPEDNFIELGGDSLLGIEIINLIHLRMNKKISYQEFFQNPKIIDLAKLLEVKERALFQNIPKAPFQELYPLSYGQRRLWILQQMQDHPVAYNMYDTYQFDKEIDLIAFQNAFNLLVERHAAFRSIFIDVNGVPFQKILKAHPFDLTIRYVNFIEDAHEQINLFKNSCLDLENGPLAKAILFILPNNVSIFFFMVHHIISDGWSIRNIIDELLKLYQGIELKPLFIDTYDFCYWQHHNNLNQKFANLKDFWFKKLASPLPVSELPGDKIRPAVFNFQGARKKFAISEELEGLLSKSASSESATLFMLLLSSVYILIYKYTGQTDIIVGSPISGRFHSELSPLVGFFVNTLALRCHLNPAASYSNFIQYVKEQMFEYFEHQDYPFDLLVDQLKLERDTSRSPLFNINVAFQNFELEEESKKVLNELNAQRIELPHESCKWDLEFEFTKQQDGSLTCTVEYYTSIYSEEMIASLIANYQALLHSLLKEPQCPISDVKVSYINSIVKGPLTNNLCLPLHRTFENQVAMSPNQVAVKLENQALTYEQLNQLSNQLAWFLKKDIGLQIEQCVGIYLENSIETIIAILAILKAGGAYVPLDTKAPLERIQHIIQETKMKSVISQKRFLRALYELQWTTSLNSYVCVDTQHINDEIEQIETSFMNVELWDQVAREGNDEIASSGWVSSYTGLPFSNEEMEEYKYNIYKKLQPYLNQSSRVLEIGCGSGLTAFTIAPHVDYYLGVDISPAILEKNIQKAHDQEYKNLKFLCFEAYSIDSLEESNFDIIIINSVIHCFPGANYLKNVLRKVVTLTKQKAIVFLGDLMDLNLKSQLIDSLRQFKYSKNDSQLRTKLDWNSEFFVSKNYLHDLQKELFGINKIEFSHKEGKIVNELTQFRYDAILHIDTSTVNYKDKQKHQYDKSYYKDLSVDNLEYDVCDKNLAYTLFTSGSTGIPKGVMVEHGSIQNYIQWAINYYSRNDKLNFAFYSPLQFDLTVTSIFAPLLSGGTLRVLQGEIDEVFESLTHFDDCNIIKLTPTHLTMIWEKKIKFPSIKQFIVGGETLYASQIAQLKTIYDSTINVYNEYGPTEATVGCIAYLCDLSEKEGVIQIGRPINNCTIHILDENSKPVPIGGIGEIVIEGNCLARGYLNQFDLTAKKFKTHPMSQACYYQTGDLGRYLPSGALVCLGRKDRQVKIRGYRIELDEIEVRLRQHSSIKSCAVVIKEGLNGLKALYGYYTSTANLASEELQQFLAQRLPVYMIPSFLIPLEEIPVTRNGKIDFSKLPDFEFQKSKIIAEPISDVEIALHEIWCRVLNLNPDFLSIEDDFFDLGGDSIIAMRILPQMKQLGINLSIKEIFQFRTIKKICQNIKTYVVNHSISQEQVIGFTRFSPIQKWFEKLNLMHPEYFNMAYIFQVPANLDIERLKKSFEICFEHHDILRCIVKNGQPEIVPASNLKFVITEHSLDYLSTQDQRNEMHRICDQIQSSFNLELAPLIKVSIFDLGNGQKRLFMAIHHLIIDGVSWRYLIEDLSSLYFSSCLKPLSLKTDSYQAYVRKLYDLPEISRDKIKSWLDIDVSSFSKLSSFSCPEIGETKEVYIRLSQDETKLLISNNQKFHKVNVEEILLSAFVHSMHESFGIQKILIHNEGHGRQTIDNLDVSRTLGWFTTMYPLPLEIGDDFVATLLKTKHTREIFSSNDLNYMISRFIQNNPELSKLNPEILFNYFGRVDADLIKQDEGQLFSNSNEDVNRTSHLSNRLPHLIEINAIIIEDQLRISITYHFHAFDEKVIDFWISSFKGKIIDYLMEKERVVYQLTGYPE